MKSNSSHHPAGEAGPFNQDGGTAQSGILFVTKGDGPGGDLPQEFCHGKATIRSSIL